MRGFVDKLVEVSSWATSYFMEPYDSYKRRKGYMDKMLKTLAEAMGIAPDSRLVPVLEYITDVVSNQMGLGKTEPEREMVFSVVAEVLEALIDLLTRLEEARGIEGYGELYERVLDVLELLHFGTGVRDIRATQRILRGLYRVVDEAVKGGVSERVLTVLDEVVFVLSQSEDPQRAADVMR